MATRKGSKENQAEKGSIHGRDDLLDVVDTRTPKGRVASSCGVQPSTQLSARYQAHAVLRWLASVRARRGGWVGGRTVEPDDQVPPRGQPGSDFTHLLRHVGNRWYCACPREASTFMRARICRTPFARRRLARAGPFFLVAKVVQHRITKHTCSHERILTKTAVKTIYIFHRKETTCNNHCQVTIHQRVYSDLATRLQQHPLQRNTHSQPS